MIDTFRNPVKFVVYLTICLDLYILLVGSSTGGGLIWIVSLDSVAQAYRLPKTCNCTRKLKYKSKSAMTLHMGSVGMNHHSRRLNMIVTKAFLQIVRFKVFIQCFCFLFTRYTLQYISHWPLKANVLPEQFMVNHQTLPWNQLEFNKRQTWLSAVSICGSARAQAF